jgi:hypothetical protein
MRLWVTDVCVPLSRLAQVISETEADFRQSPVKLPCPIVGHVADGNFHCLVPFNSSDTAEVAEMRRLNERLVQRALAYEGTASGEHGVGMGKIDALYQVRPALSRARACVCVLCQSSCTALTERDAVVVGSVVRTGAWADSGAGDDQHQASPGPAHDHEPPQALPPRQPSRRRFLVSPQSRTLI